MAKNGDSRFPWRPAVLGPLTAILFVLAIYFYNNMQPDVGLALLGMAFTVPMVWIVLVAREADSAESQVRPFVPRITAVLVLGSLFLAYMTWDVDRHIAFMECAFTVVYVAAGAFAMRIFNSKPRRPTLTALSGGIHTPRQRREARRGK
jgi:hypothetical protein